MECVRRRKWKVGRLLWSLAVVGVLLKGAQWCIKIGSDYDSNVAYTAGRDVFERERVRRERDLGLFNWFLYRKGISA